MRFAGTAGSRASAIASLIERYASLSAIFGSESPPVVLTDSAIVKRTFQRRGFEVEPLHRYLKRSVPPDQAIVISTSAESFPPDVSLEKRFKHAAVLDIPLLAFEANPHAIEYLARRLATIDFQDACAKSLSTVDLIEHATSPLRIISGRSDLCSVELGQDVSIALPKLQPRIDAGEWISIAQFLEVGLVPNEAYSSFSVTGTLECDGAAVAHHRQNSSVAEPIAKRAWAELQKVRARNGFPLRVAIEDSCVIGIETSDGQDILGVLEPLTDETFHGRLIEVSFASLPSSPEVDWSINSQLNEASGGFHVALGTGIQAAHIDFICSGARLESCLDNGGSAADRLDRRFHGS